MNAVARPSHFFVPKFFLKTGLRLSLVLAFCCMFATSFLTSSPVAASFIVTNASDGISDGVCDAAGTGDGCTLREAMVTAIAKSSQSPQEVRLSGITGTIELNSPLPTLKSVIVTGPGAPLLTIRPASGGNYRIFEIETGAIVYISGLTLSNGALTDSGSHGGAISNSGTAYIVRCIIANNSAASSGGGIYNSGSLFVDESEISSNSAVSGGAVFNDTGSVTIEDSTISGNTAPNGGAIAANDALEQSATLTLKNCTLSGNTASVGGGIQNMGGGISLESCTVTDNTADAAQGAGIASAANADTRTELKNTIVSANHGSDTDFIGGSANSYQSNGYNLIGNGNAVSEFIEAGDQANITDPKLGPLTANGNTKTQPPGYTEPPQAYAALKTHLPLLGSPAIDTGDSAIANDERGELRPTGNADDIGAVEVSSAVQSGPTFKVNVANANEGLCTVNDCSLPEAIIAANIQIGPNTITFAPNLGLSLAQTPWITEDLTIEGNSVSDTRAYLYIYADFTGVYSSPYLVVRNMGGLFNCNKGCSLLVENCSTTNISSDHNSIQGKATFRDCIMSGMDAGAIHNYKTGVLTLERCIFSNNTSYNPSDPSGGAITNDGILVAKQCSFLNNKSSPVGGAIYNFYDASLTMTDCTLNGNTGYAGGAINSDLGAIVKLYNSTLTGNYSHYGGAIYLNNFSDQPPSIIKNCTIAFNSVSTTNTTSNYSGGAGLYCGGPVRLENTIVAQNTLGDGSINNIRASAAIFTSDGYNLSSDAVGGDATTGPGGLLNGPGDIRNTDPLLGTLADNGGPTKTLALLSGSPAINASNPAFTSPPNFDQRGSGFPRVNDGRLDIGAFEAFLLSVNNRAITEGNSGTVNANFTVNLSAASTQTVTVDYATADSSATAGSDYTATSGTLSFAPGETSKTISVPVLGDTRDETDETFFVNLSNATNSALANAQGVGTIADDDATPKLTVDDLNIQEGNSGTKTLTFTVKLSVLSGQTVTVNYATADGTAKVSDNDYIAASGTLTFAPGEVSKAVNVTINGDTVFENNEKFTLNLSTPVNATLTRTVGTGSIINDDTQPSLSINDVSVNEGNSGSKNLTFTLSLSSVSGKAVSVSYATVDGTAKAGSDYVSKTGMVDFAPGQISKTVSVAVTGDTLTEADEKFSLALSGASNATLTRTSGLGTITNDDAFPTITINDVSVAEGNSGTKTLTFTLTLSKVSGLSAKVNFATSDGTATAGSDYVSKSGQVDFAAGQTSKTVSIVINGDTVLEGNELFYVNLSTPVNATIARAKGTATINNDDASG